MMRLAPPSALTGQRTVVGDPYRFDDGLVLPSNARMSFPTLAIHLDPANYENPTFFNPYRYVGRKTPKGTEDALSASQIDKKFLSFGYGRQACPGRYLAVRQIKLIFARLIVNYDIQWAPKSPRPTRMNVEAAPFPSMNTRVLIKSRRV